MKKAKVDGYCKACWKASLVIDDLEADVKRLRVALAKVALRCPIDGKGPCEIAQDALGWLATSELWGLVGDPEEEEAV